jgi:hypothetical protein
MKPPLAYCTNVHAGPDLARCQANLERHALAVKKRHCPGSPMGVGLWLAAEGAREAREQHGGAVLRDWLGERGLVPFTVNGFPYGDFHQPVVKHAVYLPAWWVEERTQYTHDLIEVLHAILPAGMAGSISTLPLGWGYPRPTEPLIHIAGRNLARIAERLARLEADRGRLIHICIEPEPGCVLDHAADIVNFFEAHVFPQGDEDVLRRHLRVCHDVCHAAVMYEGQAEVLRAYRAAGLMVGKVQVSAAVAVDLSASPAPDAALAQLAGFNEKRYLHQTVVRHADGRLQFHEDLSPALSAPRGVEYRVHFHVPIYLERFGHLSAMQGAIRECLTELRPEECEHFEVETYAWGVLPADLQVAELSEGIAREMDWLRSAITDCRLQIAD